jgi:hypothetical protein
MPLVASLIVACGSSSPNPGRIPYSPGNLNQYFSAYQIAALAQCTAPMSIREPYALSAVTCTKGKAHVLVAMFQPPANRDRYFAYLQSNEPMVKSVTGPYWVASSDSASASQLAAFGARSS